MDVSFLSNRAGDLLAGRLGCVHCALAVVGGSQRGRGLFGPLVEVSARPRLVWGLHLFYFGLVIGGSLLSFLRRKRRWFFWGKFASWSG